MTFPPHLRRTDGKQRRLLAMLAVAVLFAASCSGSDTEAGSETAAPSGDVLASDVFDAEATTVDGQVFDLAQLADSDLVLWFWAPW